jgi:hypothetical protein
MTGMQLDAEKRRGGKGRQGKFLTKMEGRNCSARYR